MTKPVKETKAWTKPVLNRIGQVADVAVATKKSTVQGSFT